MICSIAHIMSRTRKRGSSLIAHPTKPRRMSHPLLALMPQVLQSSRAGHSDLVQIMARAIPLQPLRVLPPAAQPHGVQRARPRQTLYAAGAELLHIFPCRSRPTGLAQEKKSACRAIATSSISASIRGRPIIPHVQLLCYMLPGGLTRWSVLCASGSRVRARRVVIRVGT